jgi:hypothetical protein
LGVIATATECTQAGLYHSHPLHDGKPRSLVARRVLREQPNGGFMSQVNINTPGEPVETVDSPGDRTAAAGINLITVLIVLVVLAVIAWYLFTGPLRSIAGGSTTVNVQPQPTSSTSININPPGNSTSSSSSSSTTTNSGAGTTGGTTGGTAGTGTATSSNPPSSNP